MRSWLYKTGSVLAVAFVIALPAAMRTTTAETAGVTGVGPAFETIGPLTFSPDGILFAADPQAASVVALDLGPVAAGGTPGAKTIAKIDEQIAALLGTDVREIAITDLAVHPRTRHAYLSVMRGQGRNASAVLMRVDGAGTLEAIALDRVKYSKVTLPNPPDINVANPARNPRDSSITDMAFIDGRLYVAGLSNEEFSSKLRAVAYPFTAVDTGTSVEIYHGNHGAFETRSPVYTFVPYRLDNELNLIAGYLCTPLVRFPVSSLQPGAKILGTTIAELGNRNRPLDMVVYRKDGKEYLLMSNNSRGVMKIPTAGFVGAEQITTPVETETRGVPFETVTAMRGVEQLDLLNDTQTIVLARSEAGALNLDVLALP
jgi:hypothetical protein